jgi:DNA modification methylase
MKKKIKKRAARAIHPFPARMAPELVFRKLKYLAKGSIVLDPMAGSGTVLRQATDLGLRARGFDVDPLAVLMSKVATTRIDDEEFEKYLFGVIAEIKKLRSVSLPWIDDDVETRKFINYWFAPKQRRELRRIAYVFHKRSRRASKTKEPLLNLLKIAFSRLIITKERGASLARDVSHSRPHKVAEESDYQVLSSFVRSAKQLRDQLKNMQPSGNCKVDQGDTRSLRKIRNRSVHIVMTSPPYLNAIDYMRGHRLTLVWLGYRLFQLRKIRSNSIGAERGPSDRSTSRDLEKIQGSMGNIKKLPQRHKNMIARYAQDIQGMMKEIARVLRPDGRAILVVGNSCLQNVFISNSNAIAKAGSQTGLRLFAKTERELPDTKRYLPLPSRRSNPLAKRMRTETILTFGLN